MCTIVCAKKVAVSESLEIAWVAYLGQITNIGSGRVQKLSKEHSLEGRDISMRDWAHEKGCRLRIAGTRTCSIFTPNNDYWKWSSVKIIKGAFPGWLVY